jgi:hypothetical protein
MAIFSFLYFFFFHATLAFFYHYIFFLDSLCLFCNNTGERDHYMWSFILWMMDEMEWLTSSVQVYPMECT